MSDFSSELHQRVAEAQLALTQAREGGDDYQVQLWLGQIESLDRLAIENQVQIDGVEESLAQYGLSTPWRGLPAVDLRTARSVRTHRPHLTD